MGKYLKLFETHSEYNTYISGNDKVLPNVSYCEDNNEVHYNPYVDPYNGYAYVDLGLPSGTLWATMNVGANTETDYGNYYMYGQYEDEQQIKRYTTTDENPLSSSVDTATQEMGGLWHMPTQAQCQELLTNTTFTWVTNYQNSGVSGAVFTAQNGNHLFLPSAGLKNNQGNLSGVGDSTHIFSSTPVSSGYSAYALHAEGDGYDEISQEYYNADALIAESQRYLSYSIRGVVG